VNTTTTNDDPAFIAIVKQIAAGAAQVYSPSELYVFHVDTWFDFKWLRFISDHRLPPFRGNRIVSQRHYAISSDRVIETIASPLYDFRARAASTSPQLRTISNSAVLLWYSGESAFSKRGAIMLYRIDADDIESWYASFHVSREWKMLKGHQISRTEIEHLRNTPNQSLKLTAGWRDDRFEIVKHAVDVEKARSRRR
jgi:hypothetical protein